VPNTHTHTHTLGPMIDVSSSNSARLVVLFFFWPKNSNKANKINDYLFQLKFQVLEMFLMK